VRLAVALLAVWPAAALELVGVDKIWDQAPHNAFTDLIRYKDEWFCAFREGKGHVSPDGALRVLVSRDARTWSSAALVTSATADLRDPKLAVTHEGQLMLTTAGALHEPKDHRHQSMAWYSNDGRTWEDPQPIGDPGFWLWRVTWHRGLAYSIGYATGDARLARLYRSYDGKRFDPIVKTLFGRGYPNETAMLFLPDETALIVLRRDQTDNTAQIGTAKPPYRTWAWRDLGVRLGGPQALRLPDGRILVAARLYDGKVRTSLGWLDPATARFTEALALPSGGDTSYAGLVLHEGIVYVSYYSSHEGKTSIYLARVKP
jgi:hypothetical protein